MTGGAWSLPEVRQLLRVLAAGRVCAEVGTSDGGAAAAIAETARSLVTVELDPERAEAARSRLAGLGHVELLVGDWREQLRGRGPFELVFFDGGGWKRDPEAGGAQLAVDLLAAGRPAGLRRLHARAAKARTRRASSCSAIRSSSRARCR